MSDLEHDLARVEDLEATSQKSVEDLENEIGNGLKEHEDAIKSMNLKIQQKKDATKARKERNLEMQSRADAIKDQMDGLRDRLKELRETYPSAEETMEKEAELLSQAYKEKGALLESVESLKTSQTELQEQVVAVRAEIEETCSSTKAILQEESQRRQEMEDVVLGQEKANKELQELEKAYMDLSDNRVRSRTQLGTDIETLQTSIDAKKKGVASLQERVVSNQAVLDRFKENWSTEKASMEAELSDLKRKAATTQENWKAVKAEIVVAREKEENHVEKVQKIEETRVAKETIVALLSGTINIPVWFFVLCYLPILTIFLEFCSVDQSTLSWSL